MKEKVQISRREFIKGAAASAAAIGAVGLAGGCVSNGGQSVQQKSVSNANASASDIPFRLMENDESYDKYTTDFSAIFSPIKVGHMTLRNRIVKASAGSDTLPRTATSMSQNALDYYGRMADGGTALVILEDGLTGGFGINQFSRMRVASYEDGIREIKKIADRVHAGGAYIGTQLGIGSPLDPGDVNAYTNEELKQIVKKYGESAVRLKQAGFDCVEIKGATTDGLNQFVTRRINKRTDEYGVQTEENRVRFFKEIIAEIRARVGNDFSILVLINAAEENDISLGDNDNFITTAEAQYLAKTLEAAGADLVQIRVATNGQEANCWAPDTNHCAYMAHGMTGYGTQFNYDSHFEGLMDGKHSGVGAFIPLAREIKKAVKVPVGCAGYIDPRTAPDMMNNAIANGDIDVLFLNRPLTVDPELPNKLKAGKRDEVAPCTRCFSCHAAPYGEPEYCRVNPTTQFAYTKEMPEGYDLTPAASPKKVMVIGGGVAGMEAAITAAERGHNVTLYEKNSYLGGMLLFANAIKGPHERLEDLRAYLIKQMELKGVKVVTGKNVDLSFIKQESPDSVIVAVGGARESRATGTNVVAIDDVGAAKIGKRVVLLGANLQATDLAQYLLAQGKQIQIVNEGPASDVDKEQARWVRIYVRSHLYSNGVKSWNEVKFNGVTASGVNITLKSGYQKTLECDTVIECWNMIPNMSLVNEIRAAGIDVHAAGCDAPKTIQTAIHAGYMVSRYLS